MNADCQIRIEIVNGKYQFTRNMDDPDSRAFWEHAEKAREIVESWPKWKQQSCEDMMRRVKESHDPDPPGAPWPYWDLHKDSIVFN